MKRKKPTIRRAMIMAFYSAMVSGVFATEPKARERIERRIFRAQREGRIRK